MVFQLMAHAIIILWLNKALALAAPQAKPNCSEKCGSLVIPYPFGMGSPHCYMNEWFAVTCNSSSDHPKPFIRSIGLEVLNISLEGTVHVNSPVFSSNCHNRTGQVGVINLTDSPFSFSYRQNNFFAGGCDNLALLLAENQTSIGGCMSICNGNEGIDDGGCYGVNCCQTTIPSPLKFFNVSLGSFNSETDGGKCKYAFLAEDSSDTDATLAVQAMEYKYPLHLSAVLDWVIDTKTCDASDYSRFSTCGPNAYCSNLTSTTTQCFCDVGYKGNPNFSKGVQINAWTRLTILTAAG
ncbi:hypothetical protein L1049_025152 [Liquidambar formosana]|uniref:Uncharacterized protein n=1 Tax=Liquidambar formosana TaxID=63359 RepID=A0AAP0S340_LIQFO